MPSGKNSFGDVDSIEPNTPDSSFLHFIFSDPAAAQLSAAIGFIVFFAAIWILVTKIISIVSGWSRLAEKYATTSRGEGERFRMASASIGSKNMPANYGGVLVVAIGTRGVFMKSCFPFSFFHKPLFFPWSKITDVTDEKFWWRPCATIKVEGFGGLIRLYRNPGRAAIEAFAKYRADAKADA